MVRGQDNMSLFIDVEVYSLLTHMVTRTLHTMAYSLATQSVGHGLRAVSATWGLVRNADGKAPTTILMSQRLHLNKTPRTHAHSKLTPTGLENLFASESP